MWLMLQQEEPRDYVIGTGEMHSVREFVECAFGHVGLDWQDHVDTDARYFRPAEVEALQADASRARRELQWSHRVGFAELVRLMVDAELEALDRRGAAQPAAEGGNT
jgi:GDPmannose 4,6-dehydratase